MKVASWRDVEPRPVSEPGASGVSIRVLMGQKEGAPSYVMRHFEVSAGGSTPYHTHPWEHEVYVLSGTGRVRRQGGETAIGAGSFVYVAPGEEHAFACTGDGPLAFLCVVPAGKYPGQ
jgi:quercetin dioxygenase-like cupin family protein